MVSKMIVYVDVVFIINLIFDFSLLMTVDCLLKRNATYKKILLAALLGEASMLTLFIPMNQIVLFSFKIILSMFMCIIAFGYKDKRYTFYNVVYLYLTGIILGGFIEYIYQEFQVNREYSFKYLIILFISPICLLVYYNLTIRFKNNYNNRHKLVFTYDGNTFNGCGYLDSGNKLTSPISGKPIILVEKEYIVLHKLKLLPVPFNALNHHGIVNCFKPDKLFIDDKEYTGVLIGISEIKFNIEGCNALLNARMEDI